ncbi:MAG: DEAD/DEAH box helicase, partial [Candidatus Nanopelagicaceae bacterium]
EPKETYSSSEHFYQELGIPKTASSRLTSQTKVERKPAKEKNDLKEQVKVKKERVKRERVRTKRVR